MSIEVNVKKKLKEIKILLAANAAIVILKLLYKTITWVRDDLKTFNDQSAVIGAFWHGRQLMLAPLYRNASLPRKLVMLISAHTDGRIIANAIKSFGIGSVAGSSTRGGTKATLELIRSLNEGNNIAITPDGPKGPLHSVKDGVLKIAEVTGARIYPITYGSSRFWQFSSWDGMILPKPFSKGVCIIGKPLVVPSQCSDEQRESIRIELAKALTEITKTADEFSYT